MGFRQFLQGLFGSRRLQLAELARRLGIAEDELRRFQPQYREFTIPKRSGGARQIIAPAPPLKLLQRRILRRLLARLRAHPAAHGFERGHSIVTNARAHVGQAVVLRMDIQNFFPSTATKRIESFFRRLGWDKEAVSVLVRLCTHKGGLPQGAPTSPRLSNLVNFRLDTRLAALKVLAVYIDPRTGERMTDIAATKGPATYTRYADDITFSFPSADPGWVHTVLWFAMCIVRDEGYQLHLKKKLQIRRRHDRQMVTGLVVNERVSLPRQLRRRLRAVEHHLRVGRSATLTQEQLAGWTAFQAMVASQRGDRTV